MQEKINNYQQKEKSTPKKIPETETPFPKIHAP